MKFSIVFLLVILGLICESFSTSRRRFSKRYRKHQKSHHKAMTLSLECVKFCSKNGLGNCKDEWNGVACLLYCNKSGITYCQVSFY